MSREDLAARLRAIFAAELEESVRAANGHLLALEANAADADEQRALFRVMHTLKGAARAAGVPEVEATCHRLEALLAEVRDGRRALDAALFAELFAGVDELKARTAGATGTAGATTAESTTAAATTAGSTTTATAAVAAVPAASDAAAPASAVPASAVPAPAVPESVRVGTARLDELLSAATRLLITSGQLDRSPERLRRVHESLALASRQARALARALRDTDAAARAAALDETLGTLVGDAAAAAESAEAVSRDLAGVATDVATGVRALRLRPFADAAAELPRVVRDVAAATGKQVRLVVEGDRVEADRAVLGYVREALLHLARNAVDHGVEPPARRVARGKPAEATLRVAAELLGDRLVVTVSDDGAGIDVAAVRARLDALGEEVPAADRDVARRLFGGGVSTRGRADAISGRGVGLDAVRAAVQRARGGVDVTWTAGVGTTFTLEVPLTLVTIRALLVRVGAYLAALPTAHVDRALLLRAADLAVVDGNAVVRTGGAPAPLASLARVLGPPLVERAVEGDDARPAVLLRVGGRQLALGVDELVDEREVVVRPILGRGRDTIPHVSGAALLTTGEIALVLDASSVVSAGLGAATADDASASVAAPTSRARRVLVVDDSITTRTLEQSVLEAAGYDVLTGVDGADGWRLLQERGADLVVADVEMPRMDGLELCRRIRASKRFRELPVVLITALESADDRARGLETGADAYLSKSTFDQQALLDTIHDLVG